MPAADPLARVLTEDERFRDAQTRAREIISKAAARRREAIAKAIDAGVGYDDIAEALGVSYEAIRKAAREAHPETKRPYRRRTRKTA